MRLRTSSLAALASRALLLAVAASLLVCMGYGFGRAPSQTPALTLLDQGWFEIQYRQQRAQELQQFTKETGIKVEMLPAPQDEPQQLSLWRSLLQKQSPTPDVFAIDVIWPTILGNDLLDLKPYIPKSDIDTFFPALISLNTVGGRLIGLPYATSVGMLYYRRDLLRKYGFASAPATWDELENMAAKIQAGERAKGNKKFWGFIWSGRETEALVCAGLEWQMSQGGGNITDPSGAVIVDNTRTIRSWERAARWMGTISPPSTTAYDEFDELNAWLSGNAAFMRNWSGLYRPILKSGKFVAYQTGAAMLPGGIAGHASTLGGSSLAISRYSRHPAEAAKLIRFLCRRDIQKRRCLEGSEPPSIPDLYHDPELRASALDLKPTLEAMHTGLAIRPSEQLGSRYPALAAAYARTLHSVLTKDQSAAAAARSFQADWNRKSPGDIK